jgi:hypothetical protein
MLGGLPQGQDLCVSSRIACRDRAVPSLPEQRSVLHDHGTDWHLSFGLGAASQGEGMLHPV